MKTFILTMVVAFSSLAATAQAGKSSGVKPADKTKIQVVEAACGQCKFGLPGKSCDLAVRINGKAYFVDGTSIDEHGDAHADDGFCKAVRKAEVSGEIVNNRFKSTYFKLLPDSPKKPVEQVQ